MGSWGLRASQCVPDGANGTDGQTGQVGQTAKGTTPMQWAEDVEREPRHVGCWLASSVVAMSRGGGGEDFAKLE